MAWSSLLLSSPVWASSHEPPRLFPVQKGASPIVEQNPLCRDKASRQTSPAAVPPVAVTAVAPPECLPLAISTGHDKEQPPTPRQVSAAEPNGGSGSFAERNLSLRAGGTKADLVRQSDSNRASYLVDVQPLRWETATSLERGPEVGSVERRSLPAQNVAELVADPPTTNDRQIRSPLPSLQAPGNVSPSPLCDRWDVDLGCLDITGPTSFGASPPPKSVFLILRTDYFRSSNVFSGLDPIDDGLFRPGVTLFAAPRLGPSTFLIASANGNLIRYSTETRFNYNELAFELGIFQQLSPNMSLKFGWTNQQLFIASNDLAGFSKGQRFLDDHGIRIEVSRRDQFTRRLALTTYYQFRLGFADPADRSRVINSFIASLTYDLQPSILQVGLDYQFALATFTQQRREDQYQQIGLRLTYTAFRTTQINLFAGYSFGRSSDRLVDFTGLVFGVTLGANLALF